MTILVAEEHGRLASGAALSTPVAHLASATRAGNDRSSGMKPDELGRALSGALSGPLGGEVRVEGLSRLSGGASHETWAFDASGPDVLGEPEDVRTRSRLLRVPSRAAPQQID